MTANVLIVDDHEAARAGICTVVQEHGYRVKTPLSSGGQALDSLSANDVDVLLVDIRMDDRDGLSTMGAIRSADSDIPIIVVSSYDNPTYVARAAALGASDYLLKTTLVSTIGDSLRRALLREPAPPESMLSTIRRRMRQEIDPRVLPNAFPLTGREAQVLVHIALGLSNKEIARSLAISVETVKEHVQSILRKINAKDRTDAAVKAIRSGLVD